MEASIKKLDQFEEGHDELVGRLVEAMLKSEIAINASGANLLPGAILDAVSNAVSSKAFTYGPETGELKGDKDVKTYLSELRKSKPHWYQQSSGRHDHGGGNHEHNSYTLTKEQANDPIAYRKAKAAAEKAGERIQFLPY